jgi:5-methyltetrahydrofolate--homocysteine methyltransferase
MILIGETLNSSAPAILKIMTEGDDGEIVRLMKAQEAAGADYLDLNAAMCPDEGEALRRLTALAVRHTRCGIALDSADPEALIGAARAAGNRPLIFNSVTADERIDAVLPVAAGMGAGIIALPMRGRAPGNAAERATIASEMIGRIIGAGVAADSLYIDCIVEPLSVGDAGPWEALRALRLIKEAHPSVRVTGGISNVSYGLPGRPQVNAAFLAMAIAQELDSAILDVTDPVIQGALLAALALRGEDEYSLNYIRHARALSPYAVLDPPG